MQLDIGPNPYPDTTHDKRVEGKKKKKKVRRLREKDEKHRIESKITITPSQIGQMIPSSLLKNPKGMAFLATYCST